MKSSLLFLLALTLLALPTLVFAQTSEFRPLTSIPAIAEFSTADGLTGFFRSLYTITIGVAALLAVFQIIRSGIVYMIGDTGFVEKREAKNTIMRAVFGLLLVLSPAIVFGIIDERILSLQIGVSNIRQGSNEEGNLSPSVSPSPEPTPNTKMFGVSAGYVLGSRTQLAATECHVVRVSSYTSVEECNAARTARNEEGQELQANGTLVDYELYFDCMYSVGEVFEIEAPGPICNYQ